MLKFLGRFFEPALKNKKDSLKLQAEGSLASIWYDVIPIFSLPYLTVLITEGRYSELQTFAIIICLTYFILWIIGYRIRKWDFETSYVYLGYINDTQRIKTILKDNLHIEKVGTGKIQSVIQKGLHAWADVNHQLVYQIPRVIIIVGTGIYITFKLGILFVILFVVLTCCSLAGYLYFKKKYVEIDEVLQGEDDIFNANSVRLIMSKQEVVNAAKGEQEVKKLSLSLEKMKKIFGSSAKYDFFSDLFISGNGVLLPFLGILILVNTNNGAAIEIGTITAFLYFCMKFSGMLYHISWMFKVTLDQYPKIKKLWDFIDNVPQIKNYETGTKFIHGNGEIVLKNITFNYGENLEKEEDKDEYKEGDKEKGKKVVVKTDVKNILENFNLKIKGGEKLALVGHSGSGKTTIAKIISGYMQPTTGSVLVDNQDLSKVSLKSYYKYLGYLTQEPMVFDGSIRENLLYSVSDVKKSEKQELEKRIIESLQKAQCDFVFAMKKGLETQIGEKGIRLSGGERQRLAIAKLFLKNPEIIILDEPTSALDSFSEDKISQALEELFKGRTTIIIAHRLQTVKKADRILVIENGQIVEEGNHDSLITVNGVYAKMLNMQSGF